MSNKIDNITKLEEFITDLTKKYPQSAFKFKLYHSSDDFVFGNSTEFIGEILLNLDDIEKIKKLNRLMINQTLILELKNDEFKINRTVVYFKLSIITKFRNLLGINHNPISGEIKRFIINIQKYHTKKSSYIGNSINNQIKLDLLNYYDYIIDEILYHKLNTKEEIEKALKDLNMILNWYNEQYKTLDKEDTEITTPALILEVEEYNLFFLQKIEKYITDMKIQIIMYLIDNESTSKNGLTPYIEDLNKISEEYNEKCKPLEDSSRFDLKVKKKYNNICSEFKDYIKENIKKVKQKIPEPIDNSIQKQFQDGTTNINSGGKKSRKWKTDKRRWILNKKKSLHKIYTERKTVYNAKKSKKNRLTKRRR